MSSGAISRLLKGLVGSIILAIVVITIDVDLLGGYYIVSLPICLVWFLVAIARSLFWPLIWRKNWLLAISRILIPVAMFWLALALGNTFPDRAMQADAALIIQACEHYRAKNGVYPETLDVLVPEYLKSASPAFTYFVEKDKGFHSRKVYCFRYPEYGKEHLLWYTDIPPFHIQAYSFETADWVGFD